MSDSTEGSRKTRVLIVDDHRSFAEALSTAVELQDDITPVGIAATVEEAVQMTKRYVPDVVLMDVRLPDQDGIKGTELVKRVNDDVRVVILTGHADAGVMARAAAAGACGFLPKESPMSDILAAIRTASEGGMLVQASALPTILKRLPRDGRATTGRGAQLTEREMEVLSLMGQGLDPQAISRQLSISVHTCRGHVKSILNKLGAHSQLEAVVTAVREGLLAFPA